MSRRATRCDHGAALGRRPTARRAPLVASGPPTPILSRSKCAPGAASTASALRTALGVRMFRLVAAVAVTGPTTIASARWLAEAHALKLHALKWERLQAALFGGRACKARAGRQMAGLLLQSDRR